MALSIGELVGYIGLDASGFQSGLDDAWAALGDGKWGTAAGAVGLAAGAALTAGLVQSIQTEGAVNKMNASLGLTGDAAARAGEIAGNLYSNAYGESMEDVTAATEAVMSSIPGMMDASAADVEGLTASVMDLAAAFDVDVAEASQVAGALMRDGLAKDGTEAMDLLTASMQQVPAGVRGEILPVMSEYSKHFAGLGFTGEEAMGLIVAASQDGAIGMDKAGDAVKEFQIRATDMSKASGEAYEALGLDQEDMTTKLLAGGDTAQGAFQTIVGAIQDMDDPVAQSQAALALFGTPLEDLSADQIPAFIDSLAGAGGGLGEVEGAASRMGETLNSGTAVQMEEFKRKALGAFSEIAGQALPYLQPVMDFLIQFAPVIAPVVTVLGALGGAFAILGPIISGVSAVLPVLGAAFAFITGPIGLAILAVGAVVAAVWAIVTNWETISAWLQGAFAAFGAWWSTVWGGFVNGVTAAWSAIVGAVQGAWSGMVAWLSAAGAATGTWWSGLWSGLGGLVSGAWAGITGAISGAWSAVVGWLQAAGATLAAWWNAYWSGWAAILSGAWAFITGALSAAWSGIVGFFTSAGAALSSWWSGLWSGLAGLLSAAWAGITGTVAAAWGSISGAVSAGWAAVSGLFSAGAAVLRNAWDRLWGWIAPTASGAWNVVAGIVTGNWSRIVSGVREIGGVLRAFMSDLWGLIQRAAMAVWNMLPGSIRAAFSRVLGGLRAVGAVLTSWWSGLWSAVRTAAVSVWSRISGALTGAFQGALSALRGIGARLTSWWSGLWTAARTLVTGVWSAIRGAVTGTFSGTLGALRGIGASLSAWWSGLWTAARTLVTGAWSAIRSAVTSTFQGALSALRGIGSALSSWWSGLWSSVRTAATSAWNGIRSTISNAFNAVLSTVRNIASRLLSTLSGAWSSALSSVRGFVGHFLGFFTALPGRITRALGNLGGLLTGAGRGIMDGFMGGLRQKWEGVKNFVGGIAEWIRNNKGPLPYDRRLLTPAGQAIMQGLGRGLESQMGALGGTLSDVTWMIENGIRPDLDVPGVSLTGPAPGVPSMAGQVADALQVGLSGSEDGREYRLVVDGHEFRAYSETVADDVLTERVAQTAQPTRQYAGA